MSICRQIGRKGNAREFEHFDTCVSFPEMKVGLTLSVLTLFINISVDQVSFQSFPFECVRSKVSDYLERFAGQLPMDQEKQKKQLSSSYLL
jgi:hypothetical protein